MSLDHAPIEAAPLPANGHRDRRAQALQRLALGDEQGATELIRAELATGEPAVDWATSVIVDTMQADDLTFAGAFARIVAEARFGGHLPNTPGGAPAMAGSDDRKLSAGKLAHDIAQLTYLKSIGACGDEIDPIIVRYHAIIERLAAGARETREPISPQDQALIGDIYGRLAFVRPTPRVERALSGTWNPRDVEEAYRSNKPGVVVIDNFLSPAALAGLQAFCLESTVWNANRYPNGRLGAFFDSGFNCPLVLQVAEEVQASFPAMIGTRHRLRQLWGFKYPPHLPADSTVHADFAAVNLNFWITPDSANRSHNTGGLVIYDVDAPKEWDFVTYNERLDLIQDFLRKSQAPVHYVPYRQNRAIVFNSDLFHATAGVDFGSGYLDRRINITMLYGVRELDDLHPGAGAGRVREQSAWRSPAFSRRRG